MNNELLTRLIASGTTHTSEKEAGRAFVVQVEPDLAARERINVGVGIVGADGRRHTRFVADFRRLELFYGNEVVELIELLADIARAAVLSGNDAASPSISFTDSMPFYGVAPEQYLDHFFARMVPAAATQRERGIHDEPRHTDALWREVGDAIKLREPDRASEILANTPYTEVDTVRGRRQVCVPLQPVGGAGALESADFSPLVTERKLMRALLDIEAAAEARSLQRLGLFIARPRRARSDEDLRSIDKAIDFVACRAPRICRVEVETDTTLLTNHIIDWAALRAA